jgi:uncharacterized BrkB/YihY/UPF0761 family membrane protein
MQARSLHRMAGMCAALSHSTLLSIAPLLLIVIALADLTPGTAKWLAAEDFRNLKRRLT